MTSTGLVFIFLHCVWDESPSVSNWGLVPQKPSRFFISVFSNILPQAAALRSHMHVCYVDESGTPEIPGTTSHFILSGISIPIWHWHTSDRDISLILKHYGLENKEFHTAWVLRTYFEQSKIPDFAKLSWLDRRLLAQRERNKYLLQLQQSGKSVLYRQTKKNYQHTADYIHLTKPERIQLTRDIADKVATWGYARLFAECIDKIYFSGCRPLGSAVDEQAFEQVVSRFHHFLLNSETKKNGTIAKQYGMIVHDNNTTVDIKHTRLMRRFHHKGTLWTKIDRIIDTPLFVNSSLTSMVQIADLCAYSLRRYVENQESDLFKRIFVRADRRYNRVVGVRHFTDQNCVCDICQSHKQKASAMTVTSGDQLAK